MDLSFKSFLKEFIEPAAAQEPTGVPTMAKKGVAKAMNNMPAKNAVDVIKASTTGDIGQNQQALKQVVAKSLQRNSVKSLGDITSVLGLNHKI
jgi:hypothetical protein